MSIEQNVIKVGDHVRFRIPNNPLDGVKGQVISIQEMEDGDDYDVMTTQCVGASPSGITYVVRRYEIELVG